MESKKQSNRLKQLDQSLNFKPKKGCIQRWLIFYPGSLFFKVWKWIYLVACVNSAIVYPYITVLMRPVFPLTSATMNVFLGDIILLLDILLNFCTAVLIDEDSETYEIDHFRLMERYVFKGNFLKDVVLWFPFGQILAYYISPTLQAVELIKVFRFDAV